MRIGLVVNPDAGLGGRLAFKGSDGRAAEARAAGAKDRAGPRMNEALRAFADLLASPLNRTKLDPTFVGWTGRMGDAWLVGGDEREDVAGRHGLLSLRRHDPNHKREGE